MKGDSMKKYDQSMVEEEALRLTNYWQSEELAQKYYNSENYSAVISELEVPLYLKYLDKDFTVFDMAAGTGVLSLAMADRVKKVVSCDVSKEMLQHIEKQHKKNISILNVNIDTYDFSGMEKFDAVVSRAFIRHFKKWEHFLLKKKSLCKKGGYIIFDILCTENLLLTGVKKELVKACFGYHEYMEDISLHEIKEFCEKNNLEFVESIPYRFFLANSLFLNSLSVNECVVFNKLIKKLYGDRKFVHIIKQFEQQVVQKLPSPICLNSLIVLKNKG